MRHPSFLGHGLRGESDVKERWGHGGVRGGLARALAGLELGLKAQDGEPLAAEQVPHQKMGPAQAAVD